MTWPQSAPGLGALLVTNQRLDHVVVRLEGGQHGEEGKLPLGQVEEGEVLVQQGRQDEEHQLVSLHGEQEGGGQHDKEGALPLGPVEGEVLVQQGR